MSKTDRHTVECQVKECSETGPSPDCAKASLVAVTRLRE